MSEPALTIKTFVDTMFGENAYVVSTAGPAGNRVGWVIDPGLGRQVVELLGHVGGQRIAVEKIVLTHGHADHLAGVDAVHEAHPAAEVLIGSGDRPMMADPELNLSGPFGFEVVLETPAGGDLEPGMELSLGHTKWVVLDTSGHSPGGRSLYCPQSGVVFTGDALFSGSIGRTDFPGSDHGRLIANIRRQLLTLPEETVVYSGHGPATTVGNERKWNPFVADG